jgi:hypothetical protein
MANLFGKCGNMADFLNKILSMGDKIEVLSGDDEIEEGSFIGASDNFVVWVDDSGDMNTSDLGSVTVRKV